MTRFVRRRLGLLALTAGTLAGCSGAVQPELIPSASVTTTAPGFTDQFFKLSWGVRPEPDGARTIEGYVYNTYIRPVSRMKVLAQAFDRSGTLVAQRLEWVPGEVGPNDRLYFQVPHLPPADGYRVTVWSADVMETPGRRFP